MIIHVVKSGETAYTIANQYGVSPRRFIFDNQLSHPNNLVIGQSLLVLFPETVHRVQENETLYSIANSYSVSVMDIIRNNPYLITNRYLEPGSFLIIHYTDDKLGTLNIGGYAYPYIEQPVLRETLPYLTRLLLFSYGFTTSGELVPLEDNALIESAETFGVSPILVLTPLDQEGKFNNRLVSAIANDPSARQTLIGNLLETVRSKGYSGVDVDFEYILPEDKDAYASFVSELTTAMNREGYGVSVALAPKISSEQEELLYAGMDYQKLGQSANSVLLMTYEWGYTYGPPMAVAPINKVREVLDYAVTQIPREKIDMGIPNYGYDWILPFVKGTTRATLIGNVQAVEIAFQNNAQIKFDLTAMSPYFEYTKNGLSHIVWFEDVRSINEKLRTISEYGFRGAGYWNIMRPFRQNWLLANALFDIVSE